MKNTSITIYLQPDSFHPFITVLKVLDTIDIENNYSFQPKDIIYSDTFMPSYMAFNVDVVLYMKFRYNYFRLLKK